MSVTGYVGLFRARKRRIITPILGSIALNSAMVHRKLRHGTRCTKVSPSLGARRHLGQDATRKKFTNNITI